MQAQQSMERSDLMRQRLLSRRDCLLLHYREAVEQADAELDAREIEDGMLAAERWAAHLLTLLSDEIHELRAVTGAIARIDDGSFGACRVCGNAIEESVIAASPAASSCVECAVTQVLPAVTGDGVAAASVDRHAHE